MELLAETGWLAANLDRADLRIVDCEPPDAYNRAHIPGAVNVGSNTYIKDPDNVYLMPPEEAAGFMGKLGIGDNTLVVAYDGRNSLLAARLWWVLNYYGHTNVKVLNGGWRKWFAEGRPLMYERSSVTNATFTPRPDASLLVTGEGLKSAIDKDGTVIWDVRSLEEYTGENTRGNRYTGHVPGAAHLEWSSVVDSEGLGTFKPAEEVREMLEGQGVTPDKQVYAY